MPEKSLRPSKQFLIRGTIAVGVIAIILIVQTSWFKGLFHKKDSSTVITGDMTLGSVVTRDSNKNGIADWEERLWGLDPTVLYTNGVSNKQIIEDKKKALGVTDTANENLNETDKLSRELFAITTALGQSPDIDDATLQQIAAELGSSIDTKEVVNYYSLKDIQTVKTTVNSLQTYAANMSKLISKYDTDTADINVVITALETGDMSRIGELADSAATYIKFAKEASSIAVPLGIATYHLAIINGFTGIAQSFSYLQQMDDNSIVGLIGVAIYKGYTDRQTTALNNMDNYLTRYGILTP